jgi:hypothetical protein
MGEVRLRPLVGCTDRHDETSNLACGTRWTPSKKYMYPWVGVYLLRDPLPPSRRTSHLPVL